jgi:5-methyltetrahydropteroyltriglutamate--homocysteine methyltransferase
VALNAESVRALTRGEQIDQETRGARLRTAVAEVARQQRERGIDIVNDGEFGKATSGRVDYGAWQSYAYERLTGWDPDPPADVVQRTDVDAGRAVPHGIAERRERHLAEFQDFYQELAQTTPTSLRLTFTGPISYRGQELIQRDIANLRAAVRVSGAEEAFMTSVAPGSFARGMNRYYRTHDEFLYAVAHAMRTEYQAIVNAGFVLQVDDPGFAESWDAMDPSVSLDEYRAYIAIAVDALNGALEGLPEDRIRYHLCWGSWHGPHVTDLPLREVVDLLLQVRAGAYSLEAANPRHEHEWKVWRDLKLPDAKVLIPGVVTHATNIVEHPEVVADRIVRYAQVVGKENVIAGTDCGLGARIHPSLAWAKLGALVEGAALASQQLWA